MATPEEINEVRLLIPDLGTPPHFSDSQITTFLELNDGDPYLAAADALDALATDLIMRGGASVVVTDDLRIEDKNTYSGLLDRAQRLRDKSAATLTDDFQIVYPLGNDNGRCVPEATARPWC